MRGFGFFRYHVEKLFIVSRKLCDFQKRHGNFFSNGIILERALASQGVCARKYLKNCDLGFAACKILFFNIEGLGAVG